MQPGAYDAAMAQFHPMYSIISKIHYKYRATGRAFGLRRHWHGFPPSKTMSAEAAASVFSELTNALSEGMQDLE